MISVGKLGSFRIRADVPSALAFGEIEREWQTSTDMDPVVARKMHRTLEPYHGLVYLVPEAADAYTHIGLRAGRMGYFACARRRWGPCRPK